MLEPGDEILAVLDPKIEDEVTAYFAAPDVQARRMREVDFLLVGGGMASAYCASELAGAGSGWIGPAGGAGEGPAVRAPAALQGVPARRGRARATPCVNRREWYEENDVELLSGKSVMSLDAGERVAKIQGGEEVRFGKALLATGAMVNILRVDGAELDGIHYLRAFGNSDSIREEAKAAEPGVLIGGSYIGCEVAASLTEMGVECTIVMLEEVALSTGFGEEAGRFFQEVLESKGVEFVGGDVARVVRGRRAGREGRDRGAGARSSATSASSARACVRT